MRKSILTLLVLTVLCGLSIGPAIAADSAKPLTPTTLPGGKVVAAAEAKALFDGKQIQFFDMRSAVNFGKGHIPGAKALPYKENSEFTASFDESVDQFDLTQLPADKSMAMLFYSDGPTGWKSYKAAVKAIKAGYTKVMWFREGFASWQAAQYPVE